MTERTVSDRVAGIEPQQIRRLFDLAAEHGGDDTVHLEVGEPDFQTPDHVVEAAVDAARGGETNYTPNAGIDPLREAVAAEFRDRGIDADADRVVVTTGGVEALYLTLLTVTDPGDEVVVPTPAWPNPLSQAELAGATPVEVPLPAEDGFAFDADRVIAALTDRTAAVVLTSPSNPTGRVFDVDEMDRVVSAAADYDAVVVADEVYHRLAYDDAQPSLAAVTDHPERVVTVDSCSKTYAMTGWRVGWLTGPEPVTTAVTKIHESTTSCVNSPAQYAALAALTGPEEPAREMKSAFERRRDRFVARLGEIPRVSMARPEGAFYAFVDVSALSGTSMDVAERLLFDYDVVAAPGSAFGDAGEGYLRFSFANDVERIDAGLDRFEAMVRAEPRR
ncbi:pyridoxal phosphate-dependent aminotransferase [Halogeometricum limi]|uniref:Aminotransferase n=1 Tax=Halogeometricum limi TaxID=555875 RepID=A0A1I6GQV7_9EURY|nr:pyridoxal phosphate-dependent aminotransferase [Halogeometricum limi]SFR44471.1 aspartate aminotransferase [Halogeometricum limi]